MVVRLAAVSLLVVMFLLMLGSVQEDALTYDEPAHIVAGYSYLRWQDARLNPEHPPLLKMLAAAPLLLLDLQFPLTSPAWHHINGQWHLAYLFLYESGNDPHRIAAQARLGPMLLTIFLGGVLFVWTQRFAGALAAVLALFFYAFSPTLLAHGRFVATDVAAACGVTLAGFALIQFLRQPLPRVALMAGLALGTALLCKFSTILLVPFFAMLTLLWILLEPKRRVRYLLGGVVISLSAALLLLLPYLWITAQYPAEKQLWDTYYSLFDVADGPAGRTGGETVEEYFALLRQDRTRDLRACVGLDAVERHPPRLTRCPAELAIFLADKPLWRAWGQYLFGLTVVIHHVRAGGTADFPLYFLGEVSTAGWLSYFPVVYALREPLAFLLLTAVALCLAFSRVWSSSWGLWSILSWLRSHPAETVMLSWLALYWGVAITANLNLGIRHLLPVFPFTMILVTREISRWLKRAPATARARLMRRAKSVTVAAVLLWQSVSVLRVYPSFTAYFHEAVGGPGRGGDYVVDFDWGQDLRRLRSFVEAHRIEKIAVDYFGTSVPAYELGEKFVPWRSAQGPPTDWLAVSVAILKVAQGRWEPALGHSTEDAYEWLRGREPVAKIGYSIFVFDLRHGR